MEFLTSGETARLLNMSTDNVRALERRGKLKATKTQTGQRIFLRADVERFFEERSKKIKSKS